jgi:hypothetical protein
VWIELPALRKQVNSRPPLIGTMTVADFTDVELAGNAGKFAQVNELLV